MPDEVTRLNTKNDTHTVNKVSSSSPIRNKSLSGTRDTAYEKIRVIAMILTVAIHCSGSLEKETVSEQYLYYILSSVFFTCNGLFFMLSGKFALATKCESFNEYYRYYTKKLLTLAIPILFYMFLRNIYDNGLGLLQLSFWKTYIKNVLSGYTDNEYWFLYTIMGLILLAPFLNKMVAGLKKEEIYLFLYLGLLYNSIVTYGPYFNLSFSWNYIFGSWVFYFFLGYFLEKIIDTPKKESLIILIGMLSLVITFIQKQYDYINHIHDLAPTYTFMVCAMFFLLKKEHHMKNNTFLNTLIIRCGKYSFAVYMVHNPVRWFLVDTMHLPTSGNYLLSLLMLVACTLIISFILAFICENTFVRALKWCACKVMNIINVTNRNFFI